LYPVNLHEIYFFDCLVNFLFQIFFSLITYSFVFIIHIFYILFHNNPKESLGFSHFMVIELHEFIVFVQRVLESDILVESNYKYDAGQMFF
jgi:hypothetical protein